MKGNVLTFLLMVRGGQKDPAPPIAAVVPASADHGKPCAPKGAAQKPCGKALPGVWEASFEGGREGEVVEEICSEGTRGFLGGTEAISMVLAVPLSSASGCCSLQEACAAILVFLPSPLSTQLLT